MHSSLVYDKINQTTDHPKSLRDNILDRHKSAMIDSKNIFHKGHSDARLREGDNRDKCYSNPNPELFKNGSN